MLGIACHLPCFTRYVNNSFKKPIKTIVFETGLRLITNKTGDSFVFKDVQRRFVLTPHLESVNIYIFFFVFTKIILYFYQIPPVVTLVNMQFLVTKTI